jgi:glutamine synthetase
MTTIRQKVLETIGINGNRHTHPEGESLTLISDIFGKNMFSLSVMKEYLPEADYHAVRNALKQGTPMDESSTESIAKGLKKWALDNGATHYTHWFQPLTGGTAEKHDAFFKPSLDPDKQGIESLSASQLIQQEPDASSFPSGGLRSTALARGYTIWDPSSPAFIMESTQGKTLYIPSVFISYTGEALDYKAPLLKSSEILNKAAAAVCQYFDETVKSVIATLGWEQEYFVVDEKLYFARPDLVLAGRTLFGNKSAKGQQLEDHYFAVIPERVQNFMHDFEREALKLGIPVLTRHNEVAPGQFECAPMFEDLNTAVDHNLLVMEVIQRAAAKNGLKAIFYEKPFAGINGSGKHNNWSMATDKGKNLLSPGADPATNLQFLTFFINILKAINENEEILRSSIAIPGNDHRLGANEAPPAIISVFTGTLIEEVLNSFETEGLALETKVLETVGLNIPKIPAITLDATDRNRTSPFPFTGSKFEFRAVGSSANCSASMTFLNAIVADQLIKFKADVDKLIQSGLPKEKAIVQILQGYYREAKRIVFNGNGYSEDWQKEAKKRGLSNNKTMPVALKAMVSHKAEALFSRHGIFNAKELHARYEVLLEQYIKKMEIEADLYDELSNTYIISAAYEYVRQLQETYEGLEDMKLKDAAARIRHRVEELCSYIAKIEDNVKAMSEAKEKAMKKDSAEKIAKAFDEQVKGYFEEIRSAADVLEGLIDDRLWKLPKYRELLFIK